MSTTPRQNLWDKAMGTNTRGLGLVSRAVPLVNVKTGTILEVGGKTVTIEGFVIKGDKMVITGSIEGALPGKAKRRRRRAL